MLWENCSSFRSVFTISHRCIRCVIDRDYRSNLGLVFLKHSSTYFTAKKGDGIAQLICNNFKEPKLKQVLFLDNTERGDKGFGSKGGVGCCADNVENNESSYYQKQIHFQPKANLNVLFVVKMDYSADTGPSSHIDETISILDITKFLYFMGLMRKYNY